MRPSPLKSGSVYKVTTITAAVTVHTTRRLSTSIHVTTYSGSLTLSDLSLADDRIDISGGLIFFKIKYLEYRKNIIRTLYQQKKNIYSTINKYEVVI